MTISELIERLEALKVQHGDLPVFYNHESVDQAPDVYLGEACIINRGNPEEGPLSWVEGILINGSDLA